MDKQAIEKILREEMITIGIDIERAKTGQMWAFDAERIAGRICKLPKDKPPLLSDEEIRDLQEGLSQADMAYYAKLVAQAQREADIKYYEK